MAADKQVHVKDDEVYAVTRQGEAELRGAKTRVPPWALDLLVRIDGRSTVAAIRSAMGDKSSEDVAGTFDWLLQTGLIARGSATDDGTLDFGGPGMPALVPSASDVSNATREAGAGVTSLQQQGYFVRIARRPAA